MTAEPKAAINGTNGLFNGPAIVTNGNGVHDHGRENGEYREPYRVKDQWFGRKRHMKIIGIGSGIGGCILAYKLRKMLTNYDLTIYEKSPQMAGTWWENTYPGVCCDIPAHIYTYTFKGNPDWSTFYAHGSEIYDFYTKFAKEQDLERYITFNREIISTTWDEEKGIWHVTLKDSQTGELSYDWCHVFLNTGGRLNKWKMPDIAGLDLFQGPVTHSAHWDHGIDFKDKVVAIIGTGASAIQITPQLQKVSKKLVCFMRSATWISPPIASAVASEVAAEREEGGEEEYVNGKATTDIGQRQFKFTEAQKKRFSEDPEYHLRFRQKIEGQVNQRVDIFIMGTEMQKKAHEMFRQEMLSRIGPGHEELKKRFIPSWSPGCRRLTPGDGYLEALTQPNIEHVYNEISNATKHGLVSADGKEHKVDIIVCATGFHIPFQPHFDIIGRDGVNMREDWDPDPNCYLGIGGPKFPNYWITMGPRGPWGNGSVIPAMETSCEYFAKVITKMQIEGIKSLEPRQDATDELMEHIDAFHEGSVWTQPCSSWYKKGKVDGRPWLWCGGQASYLAAIKNPRFEDYIIKYHHRNRWTFIGNGRMKAHYPDSYLDGKVDWEKLAPYIRSEDTEWDFDY